MSKPWVAIHVRGVLTGVVNANFIASRDGESHFTPVQAKWLANLHFLRMPIAQRLLDQQAVTVGAECAPSQDFERSPAAQALAHDSIQGALLLVLYREDQIQVVAKS
ncbi:hypothetical protein [Pseudomarimonas arenosa]|uniref:Uncharacterized protein n=1 Tax=Pseudomarimonas arenosa TaxID=2774145 RepID=A0AAW3ZIH3_9GAMM|nr:hypothetical protein [Pseudomarimonas arenosa]MBD8525888.1 hypothetical protein [Pseudomarimonas arenosa]